MVVRSYDSLCLFCTTIYVLNYINEDIFQKNFPYKSQNVHTNERKIKDRCKQRMKAGAKGQSAPFSNIVHQCRKYIKIYVKVNVVHRKCKREPRTNTIMCAVGFECMQCKQEEPNLLQSNHICNMYVCWILIYILVSLYLVDFGKFVCTTFNRTF